MFTEYFMVLMNLVNIWKSNFHKNILTMNILFSIFLFFNCCKKNFWENLYYISQTKIVFHIATWDWYKKI